MTAPKLAAETGAMVDAIHAAHANETDFLLEALYRIAAADTYAAARTYAVQAIETFKQGIAEPSDGAL